VVEEDDVAEVGGDRFAARALFLVEMGA